MLNQLILQGRLTKDVESRETASGVKFYNFTLATDNRSKDESTFINCTAFDNVGANLVKYCGKGDMICVIGAINQRRYTTKEGEDRSVIEVIVNSVEFLQHKKEASPENAEPFKEEASPENAELFKKEASPENAELFKKEASPENAELFKKEASPENAELFKKEASPENAELFKKEPKERNEDIRNLEGTSEELPPLPKGWHYEDGKPVKNAPSKRMHQ